MQAKPFVFVARCVPWELFQQYLGIIASRFPKRRVVVFESNPAFLNRYDSNVSAIPYEGKRFLTEDMLAQVQGKVDWNSCVAMLVPLSGNTTRGFEHLIQFAHRASTAPIYLITSDNTLTQVVRDNDVKGSSHIEGVPKLNLDELSDTALLGKIGGGTTRSYRYRDNGLYVFGWLDDRGKFDPSALSVFTDDDKHVRLPAVVLRLTHPDPTISSRGEHVGTAIFIPGGHKATTALRVRYPGGGETRLELDPQNDKPEALLAEIASHANICRTQSGLSAVERKKIDSLYGALMEDINARMNEGIGIADELQLGDSPVDPPVSLVIPIHKSYELVRHQFAHFASDPFVRRQEIICLLTSVNDGAEEIARFKHLMRRIYELYMIPCRVLIANSNCSFSVACNLGSVASRGRYVLLLNSDIFPKSAEWLQKLIATMQSDPTIGIVGARLLYPDGSVQHVGMDWRREPACNNLLINTHPYKGIHPSLVRETDVTEVGAVTGACMLIRREDFIRLGMFDTGFIRGDYEDSDFCLRLSEAGYRIVCDNRVELVHLEGASYKPDVRRLLFHYNTVRQEKRWGTIIENRLADQSASTSAT